MERDARMEGKRAIQRIGELAGIDRPLAGQEERVESDGPCLRREAGDLPRQYALRPLPKRLRHLPNSIKFPGIVFTDRVRDHEEPLGRLDGLPGLRTEVRQPRRVALPRVPAVSGVAVAMRRSVLRGSLAEDAEHRPGGGGGLPMKPAAGIDTRDGHAVPREPIGDRATNRPTTDDDDISTHRETPPAQSPDRNAVIV